MKKILLFAAMAICVNFIMAQNETELLQNYKYRFQQYRASNFSLDANNNTGTLLINNFLESRNYSQGNGLINYNRYYRSYTDKSQISKQFSLGSNGDFYNQYHQKNKNYSFHGSFWYDERYYLKSGKYLHYGLGAFAQDEHGRSSATFVPYGFKNRYDVTYANFNATFAIGKGRVEIISDMSFALFWLRDMKQKNLIRNVSDENALNIAKAITQMRNRRIIDFRFRAIDQIKMVDSAFKKEGIIEKTDAFIIPPFMIIIYMPIIIPVQEERGMRQVLALRQISSTITRFIK